VEYYGCSNYNPTIYSGYFSVSNRHPCTAQYLDNYECLGNSRRQQYQDSYCSVTWKAIEVCENGCSDGKCVSAETTTTTTIPATTTSTTYYQASGPAGAYTGWFSSAVPVAWGDLIIVLLIIAILIVLILVIFLLLRGRRGCGRGLFRRRCDAERF
jgi:hypothetical protein